MPNGGRERAGLAVGDVLQDHRDFGQARAVVELEQRHVALRIDRVVVGAVGELVLLEVDASSRTAGRIRRARCAGRASRRPGSNRASSGFLCVGLTIRARAGVDARCGDRRSGMAERSANAPSPSSAWTISVTVQNAGYSQPPLGDVKSQPLPACAQVAPSSTGTSASATTRVRTPRISSTPPMSSAANGHVAESAGQPERVEELRGAGRREDEVLEQRVGDEHRAQRKPQQQRGGVGQCVGRS